MKTMLFKTHYDNYKVIAYKRKYYSGNLAICLESLDGEPIATLTVNIMDGVCQSEGIEYAYVDTNNNPTAEEFIKENNLGEFTGVFGQSGYCSYPLYKFNLKKLKAD